MESGQWSKAETALRRARTLRPDDAAAWGMLGWALWQQDKTAEAKTTLECESSSIRNWRKLGITWDRC